jgi:hypothetical protein
MTIEVFVVGGQRSTKLQTNARFGIGSVGTP